LENTSLGTPKSVTSGQIKDKRRRKKREEKVFGDKINNVLPARHLSVPIFLVLL